MSIKRIVFFLIFGCCLFGSTISSFAAPSNVEFFLKTHIIPNDISYDDFYEGHYEGEYIGKLAIGSANVWLDMYYADITYSDSGYAQYATDLQNTGTYFRYDNWYCFADHVDQGFSELANVVPGDIAALFVLTEEGDYRLKETYKCNRICTGYNYGDIYDENWTELGELSNGSVMMYTCVSEGGEYIFLSFWDKVDDFNSVFQAASLME